MQNINRSRILAGFGCLIGLLALRTIARRCCRRRAVADGEERRAITSKVRSPLPLVVDPSKLPAGWSVADPIFYPPRNAVIPFVVEHQADVTAAAAKAEQAARKRDSHGPSVEAFILFDDLRAVPASVVPQAVAAALIDARAGETIDEVAFFRSYLSMVPMFGGKDTATQRVEPLSAVKAFAAEQGEQETVATSFTHVVITDDVLLLLGTTGADRSIVQVLAITGGRFSWKELEHAQGKLAGQVQQLLVAITPASQQPGTVFAGHPLGAFRGSTRIQCRRSGRTAVLNVPGTLSVAAPLNDHVPSNKRKQQQHKEGSTSAAPDNLFAVQSHGDPSSAVNVANTTVDALLEGKTLQDALGIAVDAEATADAAQPAVSQAIASKLAAIEVSVSNAAAREQDNSNNNAQESHEGAVELNAIFYQPYLGVNFAVNPDESVVREVRLNDNLCVVYYPLGETAMPPASAPQVVLTLISELPRTWERLDESSGVDRDEQTKHNVLFHFTNWERNQVEFKTGEVNGHKCATFNESGDGKACRTYIIQWPTSLLAIRWEVDENEWDTCLPLLHNFLDTLHITKPESTKGLDVTECASL